MARKRVNRLQGRFWITSGGKNFAGQGRIELLKGIKETGSISGAAKQMGMSYKAAWDSVDAMNNLAEKPLVERASGGRHGGGTVLTQAGEDFIVLYEKYMDMFDKVLQFMEENPEVGGMIDKLTFKSSADNSFFGVVKNIERGAVSAIVEVDAGSGLTITASISNDSADRLAIAPGSNVCALINSNQLTVMLKNDSVVTSARNRFDGMVKVVKKGAVNSEIIMEIDGGHNLCVLVTNESAERMGIAYGMELTAFCKAPCVVLVA